MDVKEQSCGRSDEANSSCESRECSEDRNSTTFNNATFVQAEVITPSLKRASDAAAPSVPNEPALPAAMPEVEALRLHPLFQEWYMRLEADEADREFCCHQMSHLLDVARIAYIRVLERKLPFRKEVVYAAALLHDIGKAAQYEEGEPHEVAGARIAQEILLDLEGFDSREKTMIVAAVAQHRRWSDESTPLGRLLYEADKVSRNCFVCTKQDECNWADECRNMGVSV